MNILGILVTHIRIPTKNIIRFKGRKDYTNIFKLDIIIIKNIGGKGDNNFSDFNNEDYKKIKGSRPDKYHNE